MRRAISILYVVTCILMFPDASIAQEKRDNVESTTMPDVSVMSFTIDKYEVVKGIDIDNPLYNVHKTVSVPEGKRFVLVTLIGRLDGLREKFEMVPKFREQFIALFDDGNVKERSEAIMIKGVLGWEVDRRNWALGKTIDPARANEENFIIAFALPLKWTQFRVAVVKLDGSGEFISVGKIDLAEKKEKSAQIKKRN